MKKKKNYAERREKKERQRQETDFASIMTIRVSRYLSYTHAMHAGRKPNAKFRNKPRELHTVDTTRIYMYIYPHVFQRVYLSEKNPLGIDAPRDIKCTLRIYDDDENKK